MLSSQNNLNAQLTSLSKIFEGELQFDQMMRALYATDASVYRELPLAVAEPKSVEDIKKLIAFARQNKTSLIPRAAGTSLAGQCVGDGIVVDISKHFTKIIEFNKAERWVSVQPGVVRDELNEFLKPHGLFFSPITSTANRAMIGGMVGNNSCGTNSIVYGSAREHVLELKTVLSDGSEATFLNLDKQYFEEKLRLQNLEGEIYRFIHSELSNPAIAENIRQHFPNKKIHRRNTGYAVDYLLETEIFGVSNQSFNFCKLLSGSEGTLAFTTEIKLDLDPLPAPHDVVLAAHFESVDESMRATQVAMQHQPTACELMDKIILDCTLENIEQRKNRFFVEGDPQAVLTVEFRGNTPEEAKEKAERLVEDLRKNNLGYAYPIVPEEHSKKVWKLRSAGLGLLANIPGDKKAVACIEDTAVAIDDLPEYIHEFSEMMESFGQRAVYYAHAGAGELHLRPILDLKISENVQQFFQITEKTAKLVKKYRGSLSGEHGDGRVRAEFIPLMVGEENYELFKRLKSTWDPEHIFNPGKIVEAAPMTSSLRYEPDRDEPEFPTIFDFSAAGGILRTAEKCNGSGDCRKLPLSGGTMCPSYQATRNEKDTTRARANVLREFLTKNEKPNPFDHTEIKAVMDLCLSCKGCTSECPSNVDMASLKAEFLHQFYQSNRVPLRAKAFACINELNRLGSIAPSVYNFFLTNSFFSGFAKKLLGVAGERSLPKIHRTSLRRWYRSNYSKLKKTTPARGQVQLFFDEFTNWNDTDVGIKCIRLLVGLGYEVKMVDHAESGRAAMSKGLLPRAKKMAERNVAAFKNIITSDTPLIGIEPSAILSFRDEYPRLVDAPEEAKRLAKNCLLADEFLAQEIKKGNITAESFSKEKRKILFHGHCHQKSLSNAEDSVWLLSLPENYNVEVIPSGCCGMAGSFGYEQEHFEVSQKVGELVLFPAIRKAEAATIIAAPGTSCRHQVQDGVGRKALHPVEVLFEALAK